ncbi:hypothetical protein [Streptomyces flavofungini]|uniref:hypothetical protein n=1 Tax=Streptomyces flavofungini TaxID=68200 RepID=UPI0025B1BDAE|nr:hypothetical protein [Streptomyces flavofungini]WJV46906.1 hypothetical protein QUY26_16050 [Streptomyces flavofungini]
MRVADFQFELEWYRGKKLPGHAAKVHGLTGTVGSFGDVTVEVEWRKPGLKGGHRQYETRLYGERMPDVVFRTVGPAKPCLRNARFDVAGERVPLDFNAKALRNKARALRMTCQGRPYEYVVAGFERGATLSRPGVEITMTRGKNPRGKGHVSFGAVTGEADTLDLALAIVFEHIETRELTASERVSGLIGRVLDPIPGESSY